MILSNSDPGPRRDGVRGGVFSREELQRREDHGDLRGHERGAATRDRGERLEGVRILRYIISR